VNLAEVARQSPFVEDVVIHGREPFDISGELHLLGAQIALEQSLARHHELLICDKTVANILGYSLLLLQSSADAFAHDMIRAMEALCRAYVRQYDLVFYACDLYELDSTNDPFRPRDREFQRRADEFIRDACKRVGVAFVEIPLGLTLASKVNWVAQHSAGLST
jgi:hypothetical protein